MSNIAHMRRQMLRLGMGYDWQNEITTCLPDYYRWTQWFFLRMLERGLAYRKKSKVNWCPQCATVLANEQVIDGCCWRHEDTVVEQRDLEQWFLRTTDYAAGVAGWDGQTARLAGEGAHHAAQLDRAQRRSDGRVFSRYSRGGRTEAGATGKVSLAAPADFAGIGWRKPLLRSRSTPRAWIPSSAPPACSLRPEHPLVEAVCPGRRTAGSEVALLVEEQKKAREAGDPAAH